MQNVPGGQSSFSGRAGYVSHTRSATHQIQPATGLGQQPGATGYSSLDLTAAFPFIDPATQTLTGYATGAAAPHAINESYPCQLADPLYAYQPGGEILEQFMFPNLHPMVPLPEAAAGPPALTHGTYGGHGQQPMM
ncbi:Ankyrin repeats (many copies) family protein [Aspergillus niger]|uniref:Ankyrin repeats (Many copies) family protein n=1 Tax=Aspergillus niger TaxID=5061 RepID=A0A254UM61_ASPNG|nr:Ankyrin repeats (many copies) family protein [Aspergillus niger]SPB46546.1 unnamed protein product [Aspergillus niger]